MSTFWTFAHDVGLAGVGIIGSVIVGRYAVKVANQQADTTLKALDITKSNAEKAEYTRRRRDKLEDLGKQFVGVAEDCYEMITAHSTLIFNPNGLSEVQLKDLDEKTGKQPTSFQIFVGLRKIRAQAKILGLSDLVSILERFIELEGQIIKALEQRKHEPVTKVFNQLMRQGEDILEAIHKAHREA